MNIKLVTYNIHRAIGLDRRFAPERIIKTLKSIDADVVLLQEVDEGVPRSKGLDLAELLATACDYPYWQLAHNVQLKKGHYGNATLCRFPILDHHNIDLTIDDRKKRGCLYTRISPKPDTPIHVFNLHMGLSAKERQKQAGILFKSPQFKALSEADRCVIAGDFNDWRSLLRALFVIGKEFECASDRTSFRGNEVAFKTFPSFAPRGGLDRIYHRGDLQHLKTQRIRNKITQVASDHLPLVSTFVL